MNLVSLSFEVPAAAQHPLYNFHAKLGLTFRLRHWKVNYFTVFSYSIKPNRTLEKGKISITP